MAVPYKYLNLGKPINSNELYLSSSHYSHCTRPIQNFRCGQDRSQIVTPSGFGESTSRHAGYRNNECT